jgi:hypothetical protein
LSFAEAASCSSRHAGINPHNPPKAYIDVLAARLRDSGLFDAPVGRLRALVLTDLTQGRNPLDRLTACPATEPGSAAPGSATGTGDYPPNGQTTGEEDEPGDSPWRGLARPGDPVPLPALINLLVPAGTLLGWGTAPAQAAGWGLLDADETQALIRAASQHPRTRWCMTIIAPDGTAIAHGCARGQHRWPRNEPQPRGAPPGPPPRSNPAVRPTTGVSGETPGAKEPPQAAQLLDLLHRLNITLEPVARDTCGHVHAEDRYVPSRALKHLIHARNQTCSAPACNAQAVHCDLDHCVPYPDGPTDQCNLNPKCRRHHRTKQAPGWQATQPAPDTATWITPSGRAHTTTPTIYDL